MNFLVEIKHEYTIHLVNILTPLIYDGFNSIYQEVIKIIKKGEENKVLKTFQQFIKKIPSWNDNLIEIETNRIINESNATWLEDLFKAVIKANIIILSNANPADADNFIVDEEYLDIPLQKFIHKCYIISAKQIYQNPYLYYHGVQALDKKRNQKDALELIKIAIQDTIRKLLPVEHMLKNYLGNNFKDLQIDEVDKVITQQDTDNLKQLMTHTMARKSSDTSDIKQSQETTRLLSEVKRNFENGELNPKLIQLNSKPISYISNPEEQRYSGDIQEHVGGADSDSSLNYKIVNDTEYEGVFSNIPDDSSYSNIKQTSENKNKYMNKIHS